MRCALILQATPPPLKQEPPAAVVVDAAAPMMATTESITNHHLVHDEEKGLHRTQTGVTMSPELFEKLYLTPKVPHVGDYNKRFANPTALGFVGFVISTFTFAVILMGWGGAQGFSPVVGIFFFVGPVLLIFAMVFEWIMGNFFPMMVMGLFAVFWLSFGVLQLPTLQLTAPYDPTGGALSPEYNAVVALYLIVWGFALFTFFVFTCKINAVFAAIFLLVSVACWVLSGAYWKVHSGDFEAAGHLQKAGGALLFVVAALGWYMCFIIMAGEMRMPLNLPVGDLSHFWPKTEDVELATTAEHREHKD
ncbi:GPR1/FUN34/yaaH family-domain-containing protein [Diplogelasinospora grovesii]|uniref:GPR1/FUN34/yaaH family-domain-containing protein n=1 Tax=Diplogelasinospora grovesii TaxID=303347 RepID=A0AAN6N1Y2_9PEZI|nr:GPR1/FUN34/yaaH family-domain-containing protein [Diplogelasinospora grovesii]